MNRKKLISIVILSALLGSMMTVFAAGALLRSAGLYADDVLRFFGVMKFIQARYVNAPNTTALIDGAIDGMVSALDDPHSVYMPPSMFKELRQHTEGSFGGIGVTMGFKDNIVKIISVLEGTPGEAAGLRAGDEILAVDGTPTSELQNEEVALRIRGEAGTQVVLRILRGGEEKEYTITRDIIQVASVRGVLVEGTTIGYIRIGSFAEHTGEEFSAEMNRLADEGMTSLIIDLRENPGGLITSCVAVAEQVVPAGVIVSVIDRWQRGGLSLLPRRAEIPDRCAHRREQRERLGDSRGGTAGYGCGNGHRHNLVRQRIGSGGSAALSRGRVEAHDCKVRDTERTLHRRYGHHA